MILFENSTLPRSLCVNMTSGDLRRFITLHFATVSDDMTLHEGTLITNIM